MPQIRCSYQLHVQLSDTKPSVWRRIVVADHTSFAQLHSIIQAAMGWENRHAYAFEIAGQRYGIPHPDHPEDPTMDARRFTIGQLLRGQMLAIRYLYDFANTWQHRIKVESVSPIGSPEALASLPICLGGRNACPPESCGGSKAYALLLESQRDSLDHNLLTSHYQLPKTFRADFFDIQIAQRNIHGLKLLRQTATHKVIRPTFAQ